MVRLLRDEAGPEANLVLSKLGLKLHILLDNTPGFAWNLRCREIMRTAIPRVEFLETGNNAIGLLDNTPGSAWNQCSREHPPVRTTIPRVESILRQGIVRIERTTIPRVDYILRQGRTIVHIGLWVWKSS